MGALFESYSNLRSLSAAPMIEDRQLFILRIECTAFWSRYFIDQNKIISKLLPSFEISIFILISRNFSKDTIYLRAIVLNRQLKTLCPGRNFDEILSRTKKLTAQNSTGRDEWRWWHNRNHRSGTNCSYHSTTTLGLGPKITKFNAHDNRPSPSKSDCNRQGFVMRFGCFHHQKISFSIARAQIAQ